MLKNFFSILISLSLIFAHFSMDECFKIEDCPPCTECEECICPPCTECEECICPPCTECEECLSDDEIQNIELHISTLEQKDSLNVIEITELKHLVNLYKEKDKNNQIWLDLQLQKNKLLDDRIKLYDDLVKEVKPKWYENKWLWFGLGVMFTAGSVKLAGEIVD